MVPVSEVFRVGVGGSRVWGWRGTSLRRPRSGDGEAAGEHGDQGGVGTGRGEVDADVGRLLDDAGGDFEQAHPECRELVQARSFL